MATGTNAFTRYELATTRLGDNVREDLSDVIYNISPTEVPFTSNAGRGTSKNTYTEWQIHSLAAAVDEPHADGDEFSADALTESKRVGNYHQISRKDLTVSRRANIVNKAGRRAEMAYQIALKGKELRRDVEFTALKRKAAVVGNNTNQAAPVAMQTAGVPAWIRTNSNRGGSGTDPTLSDSTNNTGYPNAVGTAGNARALTESDILSEVRACYEQGGSPNMIMLPPRVKQSLSNFLFTGMNRRVATQYQDQGKNPRGGVSVVGAVDVYVTDFQVLDIVPNRFSPESATASEVFILDTDYWEISYLDGYHVEEIAKVGDHRRRMILVDWTVCSKNEAASAIIADVNNTLAVAA